MSTCADFFNQGGCPENYIQRNDETPCNTDPCLENECCNSPQEEEGASPEECITKNTPPGCTTPDDTNKYEGSCNYISNIEWVQCRWEYRDTSGGGAVARAPEVGGSGEGNSECGADRFYGIKWDDGICSEKTKEECLSDSIIIESTGSEYFPSHYECDIPLSNLDEEIIGTDGEAMGVNYCMCDDFFPIVYPINGLDLKNCKDFCYKKDTGYYEDIYYEVKLWPLVYWLGIRIIILAAIFLVGRYVIGIIMNEIENKRKKRAKWNAWGEVAPARPDRTSNPVG